MLLMLRWFFINSLVASALILTTSRFARGGDYPTPISGFDRDDFIVSDFGYDNVGVFDFDWTFKGYLNQYTPYATGMDFDVAGNVIVAGQSPSRVYAFASDGESISNLGFGSTLLDHPIDLKVSPSGNYIVATQNDLREFSPQGLPLRQFRTGDVESMAILPNGKIWSGNSEQPTIDVFDLESGSQIDSIPLDNGQAGARSMTYSKVSNTVLITEQMRIVERETDGTFVREFVAPGIENLWNATRGPNGDVYGTDTENKYIYRWLNDGAFAQTINIGAHIRYPVQTLWAGNAVPEPTSLALLTYGVFQVGASLACRRSTNRGHGNPMRARRDCQNGISL
jgi:hypothetical protein